MEEADLIGRYWGPILQHTSTTSLPHLPPESVPSFMSLFIARMSPTPSPPPILLFLFHFLRFLVQNRKLSLFAPAPSPSLQRQKPPHHNLLSPPLPTVKISFELLARVLPIRRAFKFTFKFISTLPQNPPSNNFQHPHPHKHLFLLLFKVLLPHPPHPLLT